MVIQSEPATFRQYIFVYYSHRRFTYFLNNFGAVARLLEQCFLNMVVITGLRVSNLNIAAFVRVERS